MTKKKAWLKLVTNSTHTTCCFLICKREWQTLIQMAFRSGPGVPLSVPQNSRSEIHRVLKGAGVQLLLRLFVFRKNKIILRITLPLDYLTLETQAKDNMHHRGRTTGRITIDCQKGGPPITASKCMIIMKICTSVTSILIRYKKPKKQNYSKQSQVN